VINIYLTLGSKDIVTKKKTEMKRMAYSEESKTETQSQELVLCFAFRVDRLFMETLSL